MLEYGMVSIIKPIKIFQAFLHGRMPDSRDKAQWRMEENDDSQLEVKNDRNDNQGMELEQKTVQTNCLETSDSDEKGRVLALGQEIKEMKKRMEICEHIIRQFLPDVTRDRVTRVFTSRS